MVQKQTALRMGARQTVQADRHGSLGPGGRPGQHRSRPNGRRHHGRAGRRVPRAHDPRHHPPGHWRVSRYKRFPMYRAYASQDRPINVSVIDATLDFGGDPQVTDGTNWLNQLILPEGAHLFDLNTLGHQRYLVDGDTLQLMDRMHFDNVRLGQLRADISIAEPILRDSDLASFDAGAVRTADHPASGMRPSQWPEWRRILCSLPATLDTVTGSHAVGFFESRPLERRRWTRRPVDLRGHLVLSRRRHAQNGRPPPRLHRRLLAIQRCSRRRRPRGHFLQEPTQRPLVDGHPHPWRRQPQRPDPFGTLAHTRTINPQPQGNFRTVGGEHSRSCHNQTFSSFSARFPDGNVTGSRGICIHTFPHEIHDEAWIMEFAGVNLGHFRYISRPPSGDFCKEPFENQLIGMNRLLIVLSAVLFSLTAVAQQDPQLTQFYQDRLSFNPAFAGAERLQYVSAFYRNQWNGLETNPADHIGPIQWQSLDLFPAALD